MTFWRPVIPSLASMRALVSRRLHLLHMLCDVIPDLLLLRPLAFNVRSPIIRVDGLSHVGAFVFSS